MGKQSRAKKERRLARQAGQNMPYQDINTKLDAEMVIPKDMLLAYLITKFVGKSGYKYISIGRYGSMFANEKSADIVPVTLHRDIPVVSVRGRYNDPERRDISVVAVHVPADFAGMVVDRNSNVYIGGSTEITPLDKVNDYLFDMKKITKEEFDEALKLEQPVMLETIKALHDKVAAEAANNAELFKKAEAEMDAANKEDDAANEAQAEEVATTESEEPIITPEVEAETTPALITSDTPIQDAEVIQ